jgi:hypothetical protein
VFLFLYTDDFERDHAAFEERGVVFVDGPRVEPYGTVAVFTDLYGNRWHLIESVGSDGAPPWAKRCRTRSSLRAFSNAVFPR